MKRRLLEALLVTVCAVAVLGQSNGPIRLWRSGTTSISYSSGRVQVYYNSRWGNICDQFGNFRSNEATVICHQLGYTGASSWSKTRDDSFGNDTSLTVLSGVSCSTSAYLVILQCRFDSSPASSCTDNDDVSVTCFSTRIWSSPYSGQIRLTQGSTVNKGLVEVYCSGQWGTVCDDFFGQNDANTVCRQLGYERAFDYDHLSIRGSSSQPIWLDDVPCSSSDVCLTDCINCPSDENCGHSEDVTVECYSNSVLPYTGTTINTCRGRNTDINIGAVIGGTIGGVVVLIIAIVILRQVLLQNKRQRGDWFAFNTSTTRHSSRPNIIRTAVVTSTTTTTSSQPVSTEPAQAPPPAQFDLPRPEAQGSVFTYNQPSNPTISDAPPPAYGTHNKYSSYNEKDEKSDLPPPYETPYVDTAGAYPTAPQAYPPPSGYLPPTVAAYPPPGVAPYPPASGDTVYPPPGGQGPNWGTAAYPPYPPQT